MIRAARRDDGSLPLAMLLVLVGVALSTLLASVLTRDIMLTRSGVQRVHALAAAQAGLDVAVAQINAAADNNGTFALDDLPCEAIEGAAAGDGDGEYAVTITYFGEDPAGHDAAWRAANASPCGAGSAARYAVITSAGSDGADGVARRLTATYAFGAAPGADIPGGRVAALADSGGSTPCLTAPLRRPPAGAGVLMRPCDAGDDAQTFAYRPDLTLVLVSSVGGSHPDGLCVDAGVAAAAGDTLTLQPCLSPAVPRQRWSYNDWHNFEGTSDGVTLNGLCFNNSAGRLQLGSTAAGRCHGQPDGVQSFVPDPAVGPGGAGRGAGQLVSHAQPSRCLDAPRDHLEDPAHTSFPLTVSACKQAPNAAGVQWNQRWLLPAAGVPGAVVTVHPARGRFCLTAPAGSPAVATAQPCPAGLPLAAGQLWTVRGLVAGYPESYRIETADARCLTASATAAGEFAAQAAVAACDSGKAQKWNVDPGAFAPRLRDVGER